MDLASTFKLLGIVEDEVVFVNVVFKVEIHGREEGNDGDCDAKEQAIDENNQTVTLIISEREFVVVLPVDAFPLVPFGLEVRKGFVTTVEE